MNDIVVVGGGITGLIVKSYLKNKNVKLYEASKHLGGILKDYKDSNNVFFSSCQYFDADSHWLKKLKLTDDFYRFDHTYGSYTDIFGNKTVSKNFAGPVYSGSLSSKLINQHNVNSINDRLKIYPSEISLPLKKWLIKIGVNIKSAHHSSIEGFQANRIYCKEIHKDIKKLKKSSAIADDIYGLPRRNINLNKIYSLLPSSGFNNFFTNLEKKFKDQIFLKAPCKLVLEGNKAYIKNNNKMICPKILIWTANPTPLFREIFNVKLDSSKFHTDVLYGFLNKKVDKPFYIQVFSSHSNILRIFVYNINGIGCFTIEKAHDLVDNKIILDHAQVIMSNFLSHKISKLINHARGVRYFIYSIKDYELINKFYKNNHITNLIFTNFLYYGRNKKVFSILDKLPTKKTK